jgi:hypothetical protein
LALHDDLLEQASHLARRERKRPKQASLRRAISAAYYAMFHLLAAEGSRLVAPGTPSALRVVVGRAFDHGQMRAVCTGFVQGQSGLRGAAGIPPATRALLTFPLDPALVRVLLAFLELQVTRHQADYDLGQQWSRLEALEYVRKARDAFTDWGHVRGSPNAAVFLTALLLQRHWAR